MTVEAERRLEVWVKWALGIIVVGLFGLSGAFFAHAMSPYHGGMPYYVSAQLIQEQERIEVIIDRRLGPALERLQRIEEKLDRQDQNIADFYRRYGAVLDQMRP